MGRIKTFVNGGSFLPGDANAIEDDYEQAFAMQKLVAVQQLFYVGAAASGTIALADPFILDPALFGASPRSSFVTIVIACAVGTTAPATNFLVGVYPVTGGSGSGSITPTLGAMLTGSGWSFVAPAAGAVLRSNAVTFAIPVAGTYMVAVALSGTTAASSVTGFASQLFVSQV